MRLFDANFVPGEEFIKNGTTRCTTCIKPIPGRWYIKLDGKKAEVFIRRNCPDHGKHEVKISDDPSLYWAFKGPKKIGDLLASVKGDNPALLGGNALGSEDIEKLASCVALIEINNTCNYACPTCYPASPKISASYKHTDLESLKTLVDNVIKRKGPLDILQLSGGEPTLHPQFMELLEWSCAHSKINYVLIVTNGSQFASKENFAEQVGTIRKKRNNVMLYLQFDGPQKEGQIELRGEDYRAVREAAIARCAKFNIPITLAMVATRQTLPFVWDAIEYGLRYPNIRGITVQPRFKGARSPELLSEEPISVANIVHSAADKSRGLLRAYDFTALPCGDPNCATLTYLFKMPEGIKSLSKMIDYKKILTQIPSFLRTTINFTVDRLSECGCDNEIGELMKKIESDEKGFRVMVKPFMDARTWDEDRIKRCCTHVIRPDGKLDSFCRYYGLK